MKKILIIVFCLFSLLCSGQRTVLKGTITTPVGTDTIKWIKNFKDAIGSIQVNYNRLNNFGAGTAAKLSVYCCAEPDSNRYPLIFSDMNADGSNDNPWELSYTLNSDSSLTFLIWYQSGWPCKWIGLGIEKNSVSSGLPVYYWITNR